MIALGSLVAETTHELNTPISTGITAASSVLEKTHDFEQCYLAENMSRTDLEQYLHTIQEAAQILLSNLQRTADLIRSFKIVAVDQCSEMLRQFDLKEYLEEILLSLRPKLKKTRHSITLKCPSTIELHSDPGAISQIISNLVMNSLIHGFEDNEQGQITIEAHKDRKDIELQYSDNGKGIAAEHLANIFDQFFTTRRGTGGSGLGLHIVYKLVTQQLHGQITCESAPGKGTTFLLVFPITEGEHSS
jgi:signal transduction histidine kinase